MRPLLIAIGSIMCGALIGAERNLGKRKLAAERNYARAGIVSRVFEQCSVFCPGERASDVSSVYPYSFILKNATSKTIIAFGVRWTCADPNGRVRTHDRVWSNVIDFKGGFAIPSGSERLVSPILSFGPNFNSNTLAKELLPFQGQQSIAVSLEAVVLGDGTALGPDENKTIPRIQARIDAERQLLAAAVQAWQQGGTGAMTDYLQNVVASAPPRNGDLAVIHISSPTAAYTAALSDMRTRLAKTYLLAATHDPAAFASTAQRTLATKIYPNVHR